jgi:hypothetical protein
MSERSDVWGDALDDAVEQALSDHHLDEVAELIERAQTEERSSESSFGDSAAGFLGSS